MGGLEDFGYLRIGLAAPELRVADVGFNVGQIKSCLDGLVERGCQIALFPEMSLCGYTIADIVYQEALLRGVRRGLLEIAQHSATAGIFAVVGLPIAAGGRLYNCAAVVSAGRVLGIVPKTHLPNSGEYYEARWFASARGLAVDTLDFEGEAIPFGADLLFQANGRPDVRIGLEICEDLWSVQPPSGEQALAGATLILNPSASNELLGKLEYRRDLIRQQSARCLAAYAYISSGPGESSTDMVFSGFGAVAECGTILGESKRFALNSELLAIDIDLEHILGERRRNSAYLADRPSRCFREVGFALRAGPHVSAPAGRVIAKHPFIPSDLQRRAHHCEEIFNIQTAGLAKRLLHARPDRLVLGVSGGLDSTLALLVACRTFDHLGLARQGIRGISMPGFGTSGRTRQNAESLCADLGVHFRTIDITESVRGHFRDIGFPEGQHDVTFENSQARERTQILMDVANHENALVLGTGDLSEAALGWCTFNGDHMSMYHVNIGVPKTLVRYIVEWCAGSEFAAISETLLDICDTPVSPELLPLASDGSINQTTESTIGPYELHDFFLFQAVRYHFRPGKIQFLAREAFAGAYADAEILKWLRVFYSRFFASQFKRSSVPDGPKVGSVGLSPRADWRMPSDASAALWLQEIDALEAKFRSSAQ